MLIFVVAQTDKLAVVSFHLSRNAKTFTRRHAKATPLSDTLGKTHTMMGYSAEGIAQAGTVEDEALARGDGGGGTRWKHDSEMGIIPRMVRAIFQGIENADAEMEFTGEYTWWTCPNVLC